jgi:hypothetical protein
MTVTTRAFATTATGDSRTLLNRQGWFRFGVVFLLLGVLAFVAAQGVDAGSWWVHGLWCVAGLALALPVLAKVFRAGFMVVLRDHRVMFTAAFALYFLFGASLLAFGSEEQIADVLSYYPVNAADAMRIDAINAIGFGLAVMASALSTGRWLGKQADRFAAVACRVPALWVMVILMVAGALASFNVLMFDFVFKEDIVAGTWRAASQFVLVGILLGSSYRGRHESLLRLAALSMAIIETMSGVLLFNKTAMLLPIGALVAGLSVRYGVRKVLPAGALLLVVLFASVGGPVDYGRNILQRDATHSLGTRWQVFKEGFVASQAGDDLAHYNTWGRLCYVPPQVAAYNFYDAGLGGDELRLIPWLFVPRALAPGKPIITQVGVDFNSKITGSENSSEGMGIFSSGYYNAGWLGVVLVAVICGWLLTQTSAIANAILVRKALLLLPFALMGIYMAFRIDGYFVADYMGSFILVLYPLLLVSLLLSVRGRRI